MVVMVSMSLMMMQMGWWTARTPSAVRPPPVNTPSCATPCPPPSTSSWGSSRPPSRPPSTRGWGSSLRTAASRATPRRRGSTKGRRLLCSLLGLNVSWCVSLCLAVSVTGGKILMISVKTTSCLRKMMVMRSALPCTKNYIIKAQY